ncbi:MAG: signal peptide peptidase SppA [Planctomycetota bacterium]|nr:MAG: signal peptide peptidase SppA [Planctomycetota bacterium]REJ90136.1 MAG: signal peptide peptidase SppA [Planctomycetota bacterium]REK30718.1 MAG: signal peptide peptidase SppA [Planctomycetota bacterium]REK33093.1 MAG: signal peptide peptidase SppA [Planctomycetota bacterium]
MSDSPSERQPQTIVIQQVPRRRWFLVLFLFLLLSGSMLLNLTQFAVSRNASESGSGAIESFHSGDSNSDEKIALLHIRGTIMPPFTERVLDTIETIEEDDDVKGVILVIDSPGGLVADSHQIYHRLQRLREERGMPMAVQMTRMAASGGYYVAMGAGPGAKIYAEPTTWTGSIGVIIPRYDVSQLASEWGVRSEPLTTGPFKDSLSPFRELSDEERDVWKDIMDDSFDRFKGVIVEGRANLDEAAVAELATGRIFTADQASANGLIDEIGFLDDAIQTMTDELGVKHPCVVEYSHPLSFADLLLGTAEASRPVDPLQELLESGVPRAMYFCGWNAGL